MLTYDYSYDACLQGSLTKAWTVDDCFRGRTFDFDEAISARADRRRHPDRLPR